MEDGPAVAADVLRGPAAAAAVYVHGSWPGAVVVGRDWSGPRAVAAGVCRRRHSPRKRHHRSRGGEGGR